MEDRFKEVMGNLSSIQYNSHFSMEKTMKFIEDLRSESRDKDKVIEELKSDLYAANMIISDYIDSNKVIELMANYIRNTCILNETRVMTKDEIIREFESEAKIINKIEKDLINGTGKVESKGLMQYFENKGKENE